MGTYLKPETTSLSRLNNKEYLNMMQRVATLLSVEETVTKLGVGSILTPFNALSLQLEDLVNRTMASAETQAMSKTDTQRDGYVSYLFFSIRTAKNSPLAAYRAAYARLEIIIRLYRGLAQMRNMEETVAIRGL